MGIHTLRQLKASQKKRNNRLMMTMTGKAIPKNEKAGKLTGFILSENPANSMSPTVATFAPAIRLETNCLSCLIMSCGWRQTAFASLPWSGYRSHSYGFYREWHQSLPGSAFCGHCIRGQPLSDRLIRRACGYSRCFGVFQSYASACRRTLVRQTGSCLSWDVCSNTVS